jgi:hypothetical protein
MATFTAQVVDLVGTFSDETALDTFITEGANEVINAMPRSMQERVAEETAVTTGTTTSEGHKVLYMLRSDSTIDQPCRRIPASQRGRAADSDDMEYATTSDPAYYVKDGKFNILPSGAGLLVSIPTYSQTSPLDASAISTITNFPNEAEYLVVLYAAIKALQQNMSGKTSDLPADITFPSIPVAPATPSFDTGAISVSSSAPTYTSPVFSVPTLESIGSLNLPVAPSTPSLPSITSSGVSSVTVSNVGTPPTYTVPTITSTAGSPDDLSDMFDSDWTELDYDFDDENIDFATWFQVVGDYIQNQEDTELAQIQMQKISTYINAYQSSMQNRLNVFNDANVEYQGKLQEAIEQARINAQEAQKEGDLTFQASIQDYTLELQKYSTDIGKYQAEVGSVVQKWVNEEWTQKFQKYQQDYSGRLQEHGSNLQDALNKFNKENTVFQNDLQEQIQEANNQQTKDSSEYSGKLQKYSNEMQGYAAEVSKSVQDFSAKLQKHTTDYGWLQNQHQQLSADYQRGIQLLRGGSAPQ